MTIEDVIEMKKKDNAFNKSIGCDVSLDEQIVKWLEELKELRKSAPNRRFYMMGHQAGYNKAIDDFVENIKDDLITDYSVFDTEDIRLFVDTIDDVAEQLKIGK